VRKKLPDHSIPTMHLARLAVDSNYRGRRLGETLLLHAFGITLESSEKVGIFGIDVWAIDDEASAFYRKYGFSALEDHPHHLLLSMKTVAASSRG
jgi:ribosomal protein S18 acetylase RimI-like enzyme